MAEQVCSSEYSIPDSDESSSEEEEEEEEEVECEMPFNSNSSQLAEVLQKTLQEDLVTKASLGGLVAEIVRSCMQRMNGIEVQQFWGTVNREMMKLLTECRTVKKRRDGTDKSLIQMAKLWRGFHLFRLSSSIKSAWDGCVETFDLAEDVRAASNLALQVVLKRLFQSMIKSNVKQTNNSSPKVVQKITEREENAIRFMAGYIMVKTRKKFPLFEQFYETVSGQGDSYMTVETLHDYTTVWTEQIDRGGLCHVSSGFFRLVLAIEFVCRKFLDIRNTPGPNLTIRMQKEALQNNDVVQLWDTVAEPSIPAEQSGVLLKFIVKLWINVRVHSFAKKWTDVLENAHTKSLRKTLKRKGTEKEST